MEQENHIGQFIEKRRKELKMTKVELAKRVGISRQYLAVIIFHKHLHQLDIIQKICRALNCDFFQHYCLVKNEDIRQQMQAVIDRQQNQIEALQKQAEEMKKIMEEKNFVIEVLQGKRGV